MDKQQSVFLVGPMGAGKSTIGRRLARSLNREFVDTDHELELRTGVSISTIFDIEGEAGFRRRESELIDELSKCAGLVLATGGGVVLAADNRKRLAARGLVVYLTAPVEVLFERTRKDGSRPLLQTEDPEQKLRTIMEEREPLYREIADIEIDTDEMNMQQTIKQVKSQIAGLGI